MIKTTFKILFIAIILWIVYSIVSPYIPELVFEIRNKLEPNFEKVLFEENEDVDYMIRKIGKYSDNSEDVFIWNNFELVKGFYGVLEMHTSKESEGMFSKSYRLSKWSWKIKGYQNNDALRLLKELTNKYDAVDVTDYWNKQNNDEYIYYVIKKKGREVFWVDTGSTLSMYYDPYVSYIDWSAY